MSTHSARTIANQANAQHSTGPKTEEGKAKSSLNAVTTALTGRAVLLATDDLACYEQHLKAYRLKWEPSTADETLLVQSIADTDWRLSRIPQLILGIQAKARLEMAEDFAEISPADRSIHMEVEGLLKYEKQLRNLQLQESRLHRRREKDAAELRTVIAERKARRTAELALAAELYLNAREDKEPFDPAEYGFVFSLREIEQFIKYKSALYPHTTPISFGQVSTK